MEPSAITILLILAMLVTLVLGIPIAFALGAIGVIFTFFLWDPQAMMVMPSLIFGKAMSSFGLLAIPLFLLMGIILQYSGIAEGLFGCFHMWAGRVKGGLAVAAVLVCTIFAAMTGIGGAGTVTMGLIALPAMVAKKYNLKLALGCIGAGGALGILIPPSIIMIIYGMITQVSVGRLFAGGILPGILLAGLYVVYILVLCKMHPEYGPGVAEGERTTFKEKIKGTMPVLSPFLLIVVVLGSMFFGFATPTEGAALGAGGSFILMCFGKKLTWQTFKEVSLSSLKLTGMVMWIVIGAYAFSTIYMALGASDFVAGMVQNLPFGKWGVYAIVQVLFFVLGMLLDPAAICMVTAPICMPIVETFGFDPVWFGVIFVMNMQCAYISPPFGYNLFYLKAIAPPGIVIKDIYLAIIPFIVLQIIGLTIVSFFPQIALWIPDMIFGAGS